MLQVLDRYPVHRQLSWILYNKLDMAVKGIRQRIILYLGGWSRQRIRRGSCSIPGSERYAGEDCVPTPVFFFFFFFLIYHSSILGLPCGSSGKESACNVGDLGLIPGLGRSPLEGKGYPLQYSGLKTSVDCIVNGVSKSQTRLSDFQGERSDYIQNIQW